MKLSLTAVAVLFLFAGSSVDAAEPWADPKLTVRDGLELWLDATKAGGAEKLPADNKLAKWFDASGKGRHLTQSVADARPLHIPAAGVAVVRFDGLDDHLRAVKQATQLDSFTVFVVGVPRSNPGPFRGVLAFNEAGKRDYESGLNIDFGPAASPRFSYFNAEGRGFGGVKNLRTADTPFGQLMTLEVASAPSEKKVRLAVNGKNEGERPRTAGMVSADEITLGSRYYNNGTGEQRAEGFVRYDVAEVIVYNRALTADERKAVHAYLDTKYVELKLAPPLDIAVAGGGLPLVPIKDPPPVQVFVPGFTVRELPVELKNVNNVKYRPDGTLVALGYDGNVWLLRDTDGDGIEDKATLFYENKGALSSPIGMDLTPPGYQLGTGLFVATKGKCALILDTDGDNKADKVIDAATGWKDFSVNIDVTGVAVDPRDGSVWFGRGTPNYANAYLLDKGGKAEYSLKDERGTIQRVSPDFKTRQTVATGIRFPVGMRFNRLGDLFATDQEGATWLPNGNPLDELLHIQPGRHYGFPPRHPKHLPDVIDEPSTFDYGPQHQSLCGFNFNEPVVKGGPTFGPRGWADDAFVTGYSRGKLYRTKLAKTGTGYVARSELFACLNMLTVDACITPDGGLVVACHSGGPDWGSGPTGKGKLYKISYTERDAALPVLTWASGPNEVRVAFDRPLDSESLRGMTRSTKLTAGAHVRAGDRFESLWPGYAVVQAEKSAPRFDVPVRSVQLTPDRRTLVLATDSLAANVHYALTLPGLGRSPYGQGWKGNLPQHAQIDLGFDLSGCEATWTNEAGEVRWQGWLPSLDPVASRRFTAGSADHDALWRMMRLPGELKVKTKLNLTDMLRPAVQPGSRLDHEFPAETVTVGFTAKKVPLVETSSLVSVTANENGLTTSVSVRPEKGKWLPIQVRFSSEGPASTFTTAWHAEEDARRRPFQLHRLVPEWVDTAAKGFEPTQAKLPPELDGGRWARGRAVFFSQEAGCAKCHSVHGKGERIGPDLSNLVHRDYASVLRDITQPSFAINPDHLTYTVALKDGRVLNGVVQSNARRVWVADIKGAITELDREDVESMRPSAVSTMPEGLPAALGKERMKDLMTYLLTNPVSMPRDYTGAWPKPRTVAEVNAALAGAPTPPLRTRPIRVVLVAGPKDHGPGEHDYPAWQKAWKELLAAGENTEVVTAWEWPAKEEFQKADVMVFYQHGDWNGKRAADVDGFLERGGGLVYVHWAVDGRKEGPDFAKRIGLAGAGAVGFRHGELKLDFKAGTKHPVLRNFDKLPLIDESYWKMLGDLKEDRVLATSVEEKEPRPQMWSLERGRGRVFVSIPGHYSWTFDDPLFRILLLRGIAWAAKEPVDRFNDLVLPGAHVEK